jgi:hypothetical protein
MNTTYDYPGYRPESPEMTAIKNFYGRRKAARSQVPLILHVYEGLVIMKAIGAAQDAKKGYMLHPLFQADAELHTVGYDYAQTAKNAVPVVLAMEYRLYANAWLSDKVNKVDDKLVIYGEPTAGPNLHIKHMLIADKVQNKKDFELYHKGTHPRSDELAFYFDQWLAALDIDQQQYQELVKEAEKVPRWA